MGTVTVAVRDDPFRIDRRVVPVPEGLALSAIVARCAPGLSAEDVRVTLDGIPVAPGEWEVLRPAAGSRVAVVAVPRGGQALRSIAMIAVVVAAIATQQWWLATGGSWLGATLASTAVMTIGTLAVNSLLPPPQLEADSYRGTQHWAVTGARNQLRPYAPVPVVLGQVRAWPPLAAQPQWSVSKGNQDLRLVLCWGYGPLQLDQFKIGETLVSGLSNISHEYHDGDPAAGAPTFGLYSEVSTTDEVGADFPN